MCLQYYTKVYFKVNILPSADERELNRLDGEKIEALVEAFPKVVQKRLEILKKEQHG